MSPTRVGLIGLSSTNQSPGKPGAWAGLAHLPSILKHPEYELVAIANSSLEAAKKALVNYQLPSSIKTYGSHEEIANDPDVDLIVVSVNVGKHYALAKPALLAKKDVFVEWPLGASTSEAKELTELAKENGVKTIVGLQSRGDPVVRKLQEMIKGGEIGEVTSSTALGWFSLPHDIWMEGAEYYLDINSGGNSFTIFFGHFLDAFTHILGPFSTVKSTLKTRYSTTNVLDSNGKVVHANYPRTAPDHLVVQGTLANGAVASIAFRTAQAPASDRGFYWLITGTEGEIEAETPAPNWQSDQSKMTLKIRRGKSAETEVVELPKPSGVAAEVPYPGPNIARVYEAAAVGDESRYATFEGALETHKLLDRILEASK